MTEEQKERNKSNLMLAAAARLKKRILAAREDPVEFIEFVLRDPKGGRINLEPFHIEWIRLFQRCRRVQIEASKSHAKTTLMIGFALWSIGNNPDIRIKLFTQSEEKAKERLSVIADMIATNKLVKLVFPHLQKSKNGVWHSTAIMVERMAAGNKDPTLEASGVMGSVEGGRAELLLLDDICDYRNAIIYPQHRETIKKKLYAEIIPMLEEDGRGISIGTPHHSQDAVASLRMNPKWESHTYAVGCAEDPFLPLWPKRWPREALISLKEEMGQLEYDRAYRCIAYSSSIKIVQPEHIKYYDAEMMPDPWSLICVQAYDLSGTIGKKSSFFSCVTLLYDQVKNIIYVADAWHERIGPAEQAQVVIEEARKWQPNRIIIEETGYQSALRELLLMYGKDPLPIFPIKPGSKSKELRLTETLPMFEAGKIFFNPALDPSKNLDRSAKGDIVGQILDFILAKDKDLGDAFAYGVRGIRAFKMEEGDEDWADGDGMSTRLSIM